MSAHDAMHFKTMNAKRLKERPDWQTFIEQLKRTEQKRSDLVLLGGFSFQPSLA